VHKSLTISTEFIRWLKQMCWVDENGELVCKNCGSRVTVNWFEQTLNCEGCDDV